jgi:hypothetical protein
MYPFNEQVNVAFFCQLTHKLSLYVINIIECQLSWDFRWRSKTGAFGGTLIEALEARVIDRFTNGLAANAAEASILPLDVTDNLTFWWNRKVAMKTTFRVLYM